MLLIGAEIPRRVCPPETKNGLSPLENGGEGFSHTQGKFSKWGPQPVSSAVLPSSCWIVTGAAARFSASERRFSFICLPCCISPPISLFLSDLQESTKKPIPYHAKNAGKIHRFRRSGLFMVKVGGEKKPLSNRIVERLRGCAVFGICRRC